MQALEKFLQTTLFSVVLQLPSKHLSDSELRLRMTTTKLGEA